MKHQRFGLQTVTCRSYAPSSSTDALGDRVQTLTSTDVQWCLHRPFRSVAIGAGQARAEQQSEVGVSSAIEWWQTTAPPDPAILALQASDEIEVDGQIFQIIGGVRQHADFSGEAYKVTVISERQTIG